MEVFHVVPHVPTYLLHTLRLTTNNTLRTGCTQLSDSSDSSGAGFASIDRPVPQTIPRRS